MLPHPHVSQCSCSLCQLPGHAVEHCQHKVMPSPGVHQRQLLHNLSLPGVMRTAASAAWCCSCGGGSATADISSADWARQLQCWGDSGCGMSVWQVGCAGAARQLPVAAASPNPTGLQAAWLVPCASSAAVAAGCMCVMVWQDRPVRLSRQLWVFRECRRWCAAGSAHVLRLGLPRAGPPGTCCTSHMWLLCNQGAPGRLAWGRRWLGWRGRSLEQLSARTQWQYG